MTNSASGESAQIDGFNLLIEALKLNGVENIYGVPGIPITDLGRMMQEEGMRVLSFRHEQNAGNAAAILHLLPHRKSTPSKRRVSANQMNCDLRRCLSHAFTNLNRLSRLENLRQRRLRLL